MNTKKGCPFHYSGLECKIRKSRDTQNNRQVWSCSTKWSTAEPNGFVKRTCWSKQTTSSNNPGDDCTQTSPDGQYWNQIMFFAAKDGEAPIISSAKARDGADCGSDHQLFIAKFSLRLMFPQQVVHVLNQQLIYGVITPSKCMGPGIKWGKRGLFLSLLYLITTWRVFFSLIYFY